RLPTTAAATASAAASAAATGPGAVGGEQVEGRGDGAHLPGGDESVEPVEGGEHVVGVGVQPVRDDAPGPARLAQAERVAVPLLGVRRVPGGGNDDRQHLLAAGEGGRRLLDRAAPVCVDHLHRGGAG